MGMSKILGEGYTAIAKRFTVSRTAVRCIIAKYKETNSVRNKPGHGRKLNISRTLEKKDVSKNPQTSAKMIVADLASSGVDVSRSTVVRALHRGGLQGHRPRRTPLLKEQHIKARLRFAREHLKGKDEFWKSGFGNCFISLGTADTFRLLWF
uniref:Transposase Tc1-like domain-containing protein n=1 Tax=Dicentrarchus labrax TaxID=13489 RepID=A0A8C4HA72_DICLA